MIKVYYEDNHIIVVEKPSNVPVMPDESKDESMVDLVKEYIKVKYNKPGNVFLGIVHRIDRPVCGIMVFAKTSKAASRLSDSIRKREFHKKYIAVVYGSIQEEKAVLENYLYKDKSRVMSFVVNKGYAEAKLSKLEYEVIEKTDYYSLLKINLITGRHHQIRVQLANINHPIIHDMKYSEQKEKGQIALYSYAIKFEHPTKKEIMEFKSDFDYMSAFISLST